MIHLLPILIPACLGIGPWYLVSIVQPIFHFTAGFILTWGSCAVFIWVFSKRRWLAILICFAVTWFPTIRSLRNFYSMGIFGQASSCGALSLIGDANDLLKWGIFLNIIIVLCILFFDQMGNQIAPQIHQSQAKKYFDKVFQDK